MKQIEALLRELSDKLADWRMEIDAYQVREFTAYQGRIDALLDDSTFIRALQQPKSRIVTCVYCGYAYPEDTPTHGAPVLTKHIKECPKHPMRELEAENKKLYTALFELADSPTLEEIPKMIQTLKALLPEGRDKNAILNALQVLSECRRD